MKTAPTMVGLTAQQRKFVCDYATRGDAEGAKKLAGYEDSSSGHYLLRQPHIALAVRAEIMRLMATEGAQIGFKSLKRIAKDESLPAAAQVAAAKALLQGAGLLDAPQQSKEGKAINDMDRDELRDFIDSKRKEIAALEDRIAENARDVTPASTPQPLDPFE